MSKKTILIILTSFIVVLLCVFGGIYFQGVTKYKGQFVRGTRINGVDCSDLEPAAVCAILDAQISDYVLEVTGRNPLKPEEKMVLGKITPTDVSLCRKDTAALVGQIFAKQDPYQWFRAYWGDGHDYAFEQEITFEPDQLAAYVGGWDACQSSNTMAPRDAYLSEYDPEENAYRVVSDTLGTRMDAAKAMPAIEMALYSMENQVDIESTGCYNVARIRSDNEKLNGIADQANLWLGASIQYNWYGTDVTVDKEQLKDWVSLQDGKPALDEDAVRAFVKDLKKQYDPKGKTYVFHTSLDANVSLKCKSGWESDAEKEGEELIALIREGAVTERQPVSKTKDYVFFDGTIGDSYAEVDLTNQHMYFYYQGELLLETDFVSGDVASGHSTPEGIYAVTYKQKDRILRGPDYESFVHYWMPFYGGYGLHDAMWRKAFGGTIYKNNGSHGCVNLPLKKAEQIYKCVETGFPVVCYHYPEGQNPKELLALAAAAEAEAAGTAEGADATVAGTELATATGAEATDAVTGEGLGTSGLEGERAEGESQEDYVEDNEIHGQW